MAQLIVEVSFKWGRSGCGIDRWSGFPSPLLTPFSCPLSSPSTSDTGVLPLLGLRASPRGPYLIQVVGRAEPQPVTPATSIPCTTHSLRVNDMHYYHCCSAHGVPQSYVQAGDPYQVHAYGDEAVAARTCGKPVLSPSSCGSAMWRKASG